MKPDRARRLRSIFDEAVELALQDRERFVIEQCGGDSELVLEVLSLLRASDQDHSALETDAAVLLEMPFDSQISPEDTARGPGAARDAPGAGFGGLTIGGFRLLGLLGRGGMGTIYVAEQESPTRRVALKLLQSWTASPEARRRFIEEANILARLQHPCIAQVFAAGVHWLQLGGTDASLVAGIFEDATSVPWIAMELVEDARTLAAYAAEKDLPLPARLELFARVCDAVQHGHARGIIHRDLKPQNILVGSDGVPKVIDFGVARALGGDVEPEVTRLSTSAGSIVGTLRYMSPEQCDGLPGSADTRSDVYSLGVVLYELLSGWAPYDLDAGSLSSSVRVVREVAPVPPRNRKPGLPRDVETIVLKALEKNPDRRFQSPLEMAEDVRRFLAGEPITARPATTLYRLSKFARRQPALMTLGVLALISLVAGVVGISVGLARERVAFRQAEMRRAQAEHEAWLANLFAADSAIGRGDAGTAMKRLDAIPTKLRGWEWDFLSNRANASIDQWRIGAPEPFCAVSPAGDKVVTVSSEGIFAGYDVALRKRLWTAKDFPKGGTLRWSADGLLAAFPGKGGVAVAEGSTGKLIRQISRPGVLVLGVAFSLDRSFLAMSCAEAAGVFVIDLRTGAEVFARASKVWVYDADFSADGKLLAWSDDAAAVVVGTSGWKVLRQISTGRSSALEPSCTRFSTGLGNPLLAVTTGLNVELYDAETGKSRGLLRGHTQRINTICFDTAGSTLASGSADRTVRTWDLATLESLTTQIGHQGQVSAIQFIAGTGSNSGTQKLPGGLCSVDTDGVMRWWNKQGGGSVQSTSVGGSRAYCGQVVFATAGDRVGAVVNDALLTIELAGDRQSGVFETPAASWQSAAPDLIWIAAVTGKRQLVVRSTRTGLVRWSVQMNQDALLPVYSSDGGVVAVCLMSGPVVVFDAVDGSIVGRIDAPTSRVERVVFPRNNGARKMEDAHLLATCSVYGETDLWDWKKGTHLAGISRVRNGAKCLEVSPDGDLLIFNDGPDSVGIWDITAGRTVRHIGGIGAPVWCAAFSPDMTRLALGSQDRVTHVLDYESGDELLQLRDHTGTVMSAAWSSDGRYLATGGHDRRLFLYDSRPSR